MKKCNEWTPVGVAAVGARTARFVMVTKGEPSALRREGTHHPLRLDATDVDR